MATCIEQISGCTNPTAFNYNSNANVNDIFMRQQQVFGCIDPSAFNYNPNANTDNGSVLKQYMDVQIQLHLIIMK